MHTRDGQCISLWQHSSDIYQEQQPTLQEHYDVIIAGNGMPRNAPGIVHVMVHGIMWMEKC